MTFEDSDYVTYHLNHVIEKVASITPFTLDVYLRLDSIQIVNHYISYSCYFRNKKLEMHCINLRKHPPRISIAIKV